MSAGATALRALSPEERNLLLLYQRGGANSVVVELGIPRGDVEARVAAVKAKVEAKAVEQAASEPVPVEEDERGRIGEWPHTNGVVRRQVVDEDEDRSGAVKKQRLGDRAYGPVLAPPAAVKSGPDDDFFDPAEQPDESPAEVKSDPDPDDLIDLGPDEPERNLRDPRRSPIIEWLMAHEAGSATQIAEALGRKPGNVSTRLRQLERGGFVRRTGRTVPGGRGGPQIEWELCDPDKPPTDASTILESPLSPSTTVEAMRRAYFDRLLALVTAEAPEHIFDRVERLIGSEAR